MERAEGEIMKLRYLGVIATLGLSACAVAPESIAPAYVSEVQYQGFTCKQLGEESGRLDAAYSTAAAQQDKARTDDTVGVILIGLPVSSMSGANVAPQIANIKGQQQAVQQAMIQKNCTSSSMIAPAAAPVTATPPAAKKSTNFGG